LLLRAAKGRTVSASARRYELVPTLPTSSTSLATFAESRFKSLSRRKMKWMNMMKKKVIKFKTLILVLLR